MDQVPSDHSPENNSELAARFEKTLTEYMQQHRITQGVACVTKGDEVLIHQGFGTKPDTVFRIASITKGFTNAAIKLLITEGRLSLDTKVFPLIDLQPLLGEEINPSLEQITIQNLLDHSGGWDVAIQGGVMDRVEEITKAFGKSATELTPTDAVRFMLNKPLQFEPGSKSVYSNYGYMVLGRVIEKISGQSYEQFIQKHLTKPLGLTSIKVGHTSKDQAVPNEATYEDDEVDPYKDTCIEMRDSRGGLISTAKDLCRFMDSYWLVSGDKRLPGQSMRGGLLGGMPGTKTIALQRRDGINIAVFFNRIDIKNPRDHQELLELIESILQN